MGNIPRYRPDGFSIPAATDVEPDIEPPPPPPPPPHSRFFVRVTQGGAACGRLQQRPATGMCSGSICAADGSGFGRRWRFDGPRRCIITSGKGDWESGGMIKARLCDGEQGGEELSRTSSRCMAQALGFAALADVNDMKRMQAFAVQSETRSRAITSR